MPSPSNPTDKPAAPRQPRGPHIEETALMKALEVENSPEAVAALMALADESESDWENLSPNETKSLLSATENDSTA